MVTIALDMVRTYLLTNVKRKILEAYLTDGMQSSAFRVLKSQILILDLGRVETDLRLIKELRARELKKIMGKRQGDISTGGQVRIHQV